MSEYTLSFVESVVLALSCIVPLFTLAHYYNKLSKEHEEALKEIERLRRYCESVRLRGADGRFIKYDKSK
jgi:hypothetical protein